MSDTKTIIEKALKRVENFPTCMSCYLKTEESRAATDLKYTLVKILREELSVLLEEK